MKTNTIAAISTPKGAGGIAVIRISGENAVTAASEIFSGKIKLTNAKTHTAHFGKIVYNGEVIDEVLATVMIAPNTFTGEDVVEISTHGGNVSSKRVLNALFDIGVIPAMPGEFTKRAFLNGKMDLSQAEAVIDIINSKTDLEQKNATSHIGGHLSKRVNQIREDLVSLAATMQVSIDYPDEDLEDMTLLEISVRLKKCLLDTEKLLKSAPRGKILKDGIKTVILGKPNVGKSSLLNYLLMEDRAIVTDIAGTTRDIIEEFADLDGVPLRLIDTAGIRDTDDTVEKIGVERSRDAINSADLVLLVLDATNGISYDDEKLLEITKDKNRIILINKSDISPDLHITDGINISAKTGEGIDKLTQRIKELYELDLIGNNEVTITNERHISALVKAKNSLIRAISSINDNMPQDFAALDINDAISALGEIDGRTVSEDIVHSVFSNFCVGK